ncbi:MAG: nucleoside deaminase [Desulfobulbaceae bacterium]|nr:MAG: nucleoside deaminase [Desulfobulbaceae bacterium]
MNNFFTETDKLRMSLAIDEARNSSLSGEVPVGAVLDLDGVVTAASGNYPISQSDPTAHAEIIVLREAAAALGNYRLVGATLYVTLEPCIMCMGAIIQSRIKRLVFGAFDPKTGAAVSKYRIGSDGLLNHQLIIEGGLFEQECGDLLKKFFRAKRKNQSGV